jgi:Mitochondrial distribution and morphology protein 10
MGETQVDGSRRMVGASEEEGEEGREGRAWKSKERRHVHFRLTALAMHPFATYVLRSYYRASGWNEDNLYANFTRSSNGISSLHPPRPDLAHRTRSNSHR